MNTVNICTKYLPTSVCTTYIHIKQNTIAKSVMVLCFLALNSYQIRTHSCIFFYHTCRTKKPPDYQDCAVYEFLNSSFSGQI